MRSHLAQIAEVEWLQVKAFSQRSLDWLSNLSYLFSWN